MLLLLLVAQSCLTLCDHMGCSTPGFPVLTISRSWLKLMSIELMMSSNCLILSAPSFPVLSLSQHQGLFPMSWFFTSDGQSMGASASASVLSVNIQGWFPLGLTGLISLLFNGLSWVFSNTTVQSINSLVLSLLYGPPLTWLLEFQFSKVKN